MQMLLNVSYLSYNAQRTNIEETNVECSNGMWLRSVVESSNVRVFKESVYLQV